MKLNDFGSRMKLLRKKRKLNQTEMGQLLGLHYIHIGRYENGKSVPTVEQLARISRKLNVTVDWLVFGGRAKTHLEDAEMLFLFKKLLTLSPEDRIYAKKLIGDFITERSAGGKAVGFEPPRDPV